MCTEMNFIIENRPIAALDQKSMDEARARWNSIAKPLGSLGLLEEAVVQIAGLTGSAEVRLQRKGVLVFCADNGVVQEGVSQCGPEVTALVAGNMVKGEASVCCMATKAGAEVFSVDIGMNQTVPGVINRRVAAGTQNIAQGPAMSRTQAEHGIRLGMELVRLKKEEGFDLLATGEMGIGNTTTASAISAVLLHQPVEKITGRGAGLSDEGLARKKAVIRQAIERNQPDASDALGVLSKLGGFDIAGLVGVFLGGALYRLPIIIDGFISAVAALVAQRLYPQAGCAMLASHVSEEPACSLILDELGKKPLLFAGMRLGEGTGAVCLMPLLDMALSVYQNMSTFHQIGITAYAPLGGR